jgi:hypothetical protein
MSGSLKHIRAAWKRLAGVCAVKRHVQRTLRMERLAVRPADEEMSAVRSRGFSW